MRFSITHRDAASAARTGLLTLPHAELETPVFMPVGTQATVKGMKPADLEALGFRLILANTYHLHLRPCADLVASAGGLHRFMGWEGAILTDSGGFQVFSLSGLRRINEEGVEFRSHLDGSAHLFTPARVMEIQRLLGPDIAMAFDESAPYPCDEEYARAAMERTHRWALACREAHSGLAAGGWPQALFGIVQGAIYPALREESARFLAGLDLPGYAIGGLAVGESAADRNRSVETCTALLPQNRPRYLMGVGTPLDIVEAVLRGVDMFDCVLPTRNARNAQVFTSEGVLNLRNARFASDFGPIDPACECETCRRHSRAYLRHLFQASEMLGPCLATHHNLAFYQALMRRIRAAIRDESLGALREQAAAWSVRSGEVGGPAEDGGAADEPRIRV